MHDLTTIEGRRQALLEDDQEWLLMGQSRSPAVTVILEAWASGKLTSVEAIHRVGAFLSKQDVP